MSRYNFRSRPAKEDLPLPPTPKKRVKRSDSINHSALKQHPDVSFLSHPPTPIDVEVSELPEESGIALTNKADETIVLSSDSEPATNKDENWRENTGVWHDLQSFEPGAWLNDAAIFRVVTKLAARDKSFGVVDPLIVENFNSLSGPSWDARDFARDYFNKPKVLLIANPLRAHWVLFLWEQEKKQLYLYDSLRGGKYEAAAITSVVNLVKVAFPNEEIAAPISRECPQQPNGFDCGLHVLRNADILTSTLMPGAPEPPLDPQTMRAHYRQVFLG
ncbi:uncharacterized protein GLRG_11680 [Colletotrichum graminicola M1.001]|uniref:Ubiquitin-like protease family profile domain-containing protein n=1 Tax=Colletotrichum graminicola (strain M1.001 / M2 / FGSC 10212) TaxID=645133 RepID=E3R0A7_COLGM|nr:uncharacterized protein GLRG_11680 [Colletotrichum graminicola M1.001]EFQ36545.1 hypothetical protein GLRG_11680 [Colletotrichum graminicola M1.001]